MDKYGYIYKITHIPSGRYYIGQHSKSKFDENYWGSGTIIKNLCDKYPKEEFSREILGWASSPEELDKLEEDFVSSDLLEDSKCLNLKTGGNHPVHSEESNRKLSKALQGNKNACNIPKEVRERTNKNLVRGQKLSEISKKKLSDSLRSYWQKNRDSRIGWHHSESTKKKISEANHNRTEEQLQRIKEKVTAANKKRIGEKRSEEYKQKMSEIKRQWWAQRRQNKDC